jgi:hypothetical protein
LLFIGASVFQIGWLAASSPKSLSERGDSGYAAVEDELPGLSPALRKTVKNSIQDNHG